MIVRKELQHVNNSTWSETGCDDRMSTGLRVELALTTPNVKARTTRYAIGSFQRSRSIALQSDQHLQSVYSSGIASRTTSCCFPRKDISNTEKSPGRSRPRYLHGDFNGIFAVTFYAEWILPSLTNAGLMKVVRLPPGSRRMTDSRDSLAKRSRLPDRPRSR